MNLISKDKEVAEKAKSMEQDNNHKKFGMLLGYPECCCDFFEENFSEKNADLTLKILENSNGCEFQYYNNIAARHFDISLLSHFPHDFHCEESTKIAKNNLKIIKKYSEEISSLFSSILQSAVIYTMKEGIFILRKYEKIGDRVIYGDILTTTRDKLYYLISSNKELTVMGKNRFLISDVEISGKEYGFMAFT